jgi:glucosamine-6-phosphate deaminase
MGRHDRRGEHRLSTDELMATTTLQVLPSPEAIGEEVARHLVGSIERARVAGRSFLLGCPTGRTPKPVYAALARHARAQQLDVSHVVLVMMDEYLVRGAKSSLEYAPAKEPWSCHHFAKADIVDLVNAGLPSERRLPEDSVWFPDPLDPAGYDALIAEAGGIDFFMLASGASDGHVAFNPPGSARETRTRIIPLSDDTRRDNLQSFPILGRLEAVPFHGVSVGIATIAAAREAVMMVWGASKRETLRRMLAASQYEPSWPATVIHEIASREILADAEAASELRT